MLCHVESKKEVKNPAAVVGEGAGELHCIAK